MKISHYDVLQVSNKALPAVIEAAYQHLRPALTAAAGAGDLEARNQLLFLEEAYAVLSSPEKRRAYDASITPGPSVNSYQTATPPSCSYRAENDFSGGDSSLTKKLLLTLVLLAAVFSAYKFLGKHSEQKTLDKQVEIQEGKELGTLRNDAYRAENERMLVQGVVQNQDKAIERNYDVASREAERRRMETEYRANAGAKSLELQQQRLDAQLQQQRWAQEEYEKDRQQREAKAVADAPRAQLCNMYALNGKTQEARAAGCYR